MAQINRWDGGLSTRLNPALININEGITYSNIDSSVGTLKPFKGDILYAENISNNHIYLYNDVWLYSYYRRNYVEFREKLYYANGLSAPQKTFDGLVWYNLGIAKPLAAPITAISLDAGIHTGTLQYCYTYYNSVDGSESEASEYSEELVVVYNQVDISLVASDDPQVTDIKLYRLGASLTSMFLVATLTNTDQDYTDNIADIDIPGFALDTTNFGQAPEKLNYLIEANAMFFGAVGDKLYYSEIANVNSWSPFNFIDFDQDITGIGSIQNGLVVFTFNKTYIIVGTSPVTLSKYLVSGNQGCVDNSTIKFVNNTLIWLSNDGICASTGGDIQIITKDKLGIKSLGIVNDAIVYNETYYISFTDRTLCLDFTQGLVFRELSVIPDSFYVAKDDKLYYSYMNNVYLLGAANTYKTLLYRSGNIAEGSLTNLKKYSVFYINSTGNLTIKIYIDDLLVTIQSLPVGFTEVLVPADSTLGYYMSYEIEGTGELLELEYKVEGRQNAR